MAAQLRVPLAAEPETMAVHHTQRAAVSTFWADRALVAVATA